MNILKKAICSTLLLSSIFLASCNKNGVIESKQWYKINMPMLDSIDVLTEIKFINKDTGYIIGERISLASSTDNFILKTINGGDTWTINRFSSPDGNAPFNKISVSSINDIYIAGRGVYKSNVMNGVWDDLDTNFSKIHTYVAAIDFTNTKKKLIFKGDAIFDYQNTQFLPIFFSNSGTVFSNFQRVSDNVLFASNSGLVSSFDGGDTWKETFFTYKIEAFSFIDSISGYMLSNHNIYKTVDGGINWVKQNSAAITANPRKILFLNTNEGYFITQNQEIGHTINGGINWSLENLPMLNGVPFIDIAKTPDNKIVVTGTNGTLLIKK